MTIAEGLILRLFRPPKFLVVEAHAGISTLLSAHYDCDLVQAGSAVEAADCLASGVYDLIILDAATLNGSTATLIKNIQTMCPDTPTVAFNAVNTAFDEDALVTVFNGAIKIELLEHLFKQFKIKLRTREIAEYCASIDRTAAA
jgi:CheY-like chemotaxis protein